MSLYLDASAIIPTLVEEASSAALTDFLASADEPLVVGDLAAAEVASAVSRLVRMGLIETKVANGVLGAFDAWRESVTIGADITTADFRQAGLFVRRFDLGLRAPDALHAALCRRRDDSLVTLDKRLVVAARALGVRLASPA